MLRLGYIYFVVMSMFDLLVSYCILSPELEANPIMRWLWELYGYKAIVTYKLITTFVGLGVMIYAQDKFPKLVTIGLTIVNVSLTLVGIALIYTWIVLKG